MSRPPTRSLLVAAALALAASAAGPGLARAEGRAGGPRLTLNGVPIDGVTAQRFENATVVVDEKGDVHIEARGYAVKGAAAPDPAAETGGCPPAAPGKLGCRYFLVTEHQPPGTQYDLAIFVNARWIREVKASEPQVVMEITQALRPGPNKVTLAASKQQGGDRASTSRDVQLRVVVGEGNLGGGHVLIDNPLLEMVRTAAELENRTEEYELVAR